MDRALVNMAWNGEFTGSEADFINQGVSDHYPVIIKVTYMPKVRSPFKFFNHWTSSDTFFPLVKEV